MWMIDHEGIIACLYGPCEAEIIFNDRKISIKETTSYPHDFSICFEINCTEAIAFVLKIRKPQWTKSVQLNVPFEERNGFICIGRIWKGVEKIQLELEPSITQNETNDREVYFSYGPLILARPIESIETKTREYAVPGFCDVHHTPVRLIDYTFGDGTIQKRKSELVFDLSLINQQTKKNETVSLVPIGKTILRQVSFRKVR